MKILGIRYQEPKLKALSSQKEHDNKEKQVSFKSAVPNTKTTFIDWVLKNKLAKKMLDLASSNPHTFNLTIMAIIGITIRPATILVCPGAKKEDKQYAAGKSVISSAITTITQVALCIPLAKSIEKLAKAAEKHPEKIAVPKFKSPKFEAYNYLVNNGFAVILTVISSMIMAKAVTKIMNKLLPNDKKPQSKPIEPKQQSDTSNKNDGGVR